ncbi:phage tail tape measure protein [Rhodoferax sp. U2-2l]|uniref:phage tail tape measure protein n=1 Tax=Rhodoferax sp. U2-2l TaxID=2884000 RepID=UPI001D09A663|nr:phage tail tape measure protein [Rhodoferax sp. U2-2l]MCB8747703.1 phage tail tape measure protein [Rhodoferax sp. U2-2l]
MADAQKTIDLIFNGVDKTGAATLAALDNARKFSGSVKDITQPVADFTLGATKLEAGLLAAGVAITVFAVNEASKFEGAMLDLQKVLSETDGPIEQYGDAARDMAMQFGVSSTEVLQSVSNFKQAGFTATEALTLTRNALDLKIAGDVEATRASELLVASLKGFNLEASEGTRIVDLLNEVSNRYATDVNELGEGFARLSPVAKAAGLSLEETAGILTPGIEVFRSGAEVANAMRTVLLRLQDDSKPVRTALAELGVTQFNVNGELRSSRDIYFDVAKAWGPLTDAQKTYYASQLAGLDQSAKFIAVMDGVNKTLEISGKGFQYLGSAAKEVEIRLASTEIQVKRMGVALTNMFIDIGTPLLDEAGGIADAIAEIFNVLGDSVKNGGIKDLVSYVETQMKALQAAMEQVAKNLPAALASANFSGFIGGVDAVVEAVKSLFGGLDLGTVEGLKTAIETVGAAFLGLSKYVAGTIEAFEPLFNALVAVGKSAKDADMEFLEIAGNLGGLVTQLNIALPLFDLLIGILAVKSGLGLVKELTGLSTLLPVVASGLSLLAKGSAGAAAAGWIGFEAGGWINEGITALITKITGSENTLGTWIYNLTHADEAAQGMGTASAKAADGVNELGNAASSAQADFRKSEIALQNTAAAADTAQQAFRKTEIAAQTSGDTAQQSFRKSEIAAQGFATAQKDVSKYALETVPIYDKLTGAIIGYEQQLVKSAKGTIDLSKASENANTVFKTSADVMDALSKKTNLTNKEMIDLAKLTKEAEVKLTEIASNERIKYIESKVKLDIANVEANAKIATALIEGLSNTITSTGNLLGDLYGNAKDFNTMSWSQQRLIESGIDKETSMRQAAFELQKKLTEAQIEQMKAQTQALNNGEGLIKITGDGLEPHLEAFMWQILQKIQTRVNKDGLKMLLGA